MINYVIFIAYFLFFRLSSFLILCKFLHKYTSRMGLLTEICGVPSLLCFCYCNYTVGFLARDWQDCFFCNNRVLKKKSPNKPPIKFNKISCANNSILVATDNFYLFGHKDRKISSFKHRSQA